MENENKKKNLLDPNVYLDLYKLEHAVEKKGLR